VNGRIHASLIADMRQALLAELGARAVYPRLAAGVRDAELARLLAQFHQEEVEQVETLRALLTALGERPPDKCRRRAFAAFVLALASRYGAFLGARRIALRLCHESETTVGRWYGAYAAYLVRAGELDHARTCETLGLTKRRHALALEAWVPH
jgi:rubrerythrin